MKQLILTFKFFYQKKISLKRALILKEMKISKYLLIPLFLGQLF